MENILGVLLLFFIQLFFLNLGINGTLSKKDKTIRCDNRSLLLKWSGLYIWRLKDRKIYKVTIFIVYLLFFSNMICICMSKIYETNIIQSILDKSIKVSFSLIPFLIILNWLLASEKRQYRDR